MVCPGARAQVEVDEAHNEIEGLDGAMMLAPPDHTPADSERTASQAGARAHLCEVERLTSLIDEKDNEIDDEGMSSNFLLAWRRFINWQSSTNEELGATPASCATNPRIAQSARWAR